MGREMTLRAAVVLALLGCLGGCSCNDPAPVADAGERRDGTPADARVDAPGDLGVDAAGVDVGGDAADVGVDAPGDVGVDAADAQPDWHPVPDTQQWDGLLSVSDLGAGDVGPLPSTWAFNWGGKDYDSIVDVSVDGQGNAYLLLWTGVRNIYPYQRASWSLVMKVDRWGRQRWIRALVRPNTYLTAYGIATDKQGNSYVTYFTGWNLAAGTAHLEKLGPQGQGLWTQLLPPEIFHYRKGVAVGPGGNVYIAGANRPGARLGSIVLDGSKGRQFVAKADPAGKWLEAYTGGLAVPGTNVGMALHGGLAVDSLGNAYIAGIVRGGVTFGKHTLMSVGGDDVFAAKLSAGGKGWAWAVTAGGTSNDHATGIAADSQGNAYISGFFEGSATFGSKTLTYLGQEDGFVTKVTPSGNFAWTIHAGSTIWDRGMDVTVGPKGNVYTTGWFGPNATLGTMSLNNRYSDIYGAKIAPSGSIAWVQHGAGVHGLAIAADANAVYMVGDMLGTAYLGNITLKGQWDGVAWKVLNP